MMCEEYIQEIKGRLSEKRFRHSIYVAAEAKRLAERYGADPQKAETAGILHDIMKDTPAGEQLQIIRGFGIILDTVEENSTKLLHAISGAAVAEKQLGVSDPAILSAIRYHTTARKDMTLLEKVLYIADYISEDRDYEGVELMREFAAESLEQAMYEGLAFTIRDLTAKGQPVHVDTVNAYNEMILLGFSGGKPPRLA